MNRIRDCFERLGDRAAFIGYVCAGDPNIETSEAVCAELIEQGVDILELGVPFSDPLADGLTNQLAAQRALESGVTGSQVLELASRIRKRFPDTPLVFYTYYNLIYSQGEESYIQASKESGIDALLTLDMPPEEGEMFLTLCKKHNMENIFIIAPTTPESRVEKICKVSSGFIYYVSREGVTGERAQLSERIESQVQMIKKFTSLPVVVGFGISTEDHVRKVASVADGVVVGSALVNCIANGTSKKSIVENIGQKVSSLIQGIV